MDPTTEISPDAIVQLGLAEQSRLVTSGELAATELAELYLNRIDRLDPSLNAYRSVDPDRVFEQAAIADERARSGDHVPLLGVPIAIKDNIDVAGESTLWGTAAQAGRASDDSEVVRRLRQAGAVVIGKTHMPELAFLPVTESPAGGITRNPWNTERTPGGSSGGSAVAVAAGMAAAALGDDVGGSVRVPAAYCGVLGLKGQRGRIPIAPATDSWYGLRTIGPLTRSVQDCALLFDVIANPLSAGCARPAANLVRAANSTPRALRIAVSVKPPVPLEVPDAVMEPLWQTVDLLRLLGHQVEIAQPPYGGRLCAAAALVRFARAAFEQVNALPDQAELSSLIRSFGFPGRFIPRRALQWSHAVEVAHRPSVDAFFRRYDLLLTPATGRVAPCVGSLADRPPPIAFRDALGIGMFTVAWNFTGNPAASVPGGLDADGLPTAVQLVGPRNGEEVIISLAAQLEREQPWPTCTPGA